MRAMFLGCLAVAMFAVGCGPEVTPTPTRFPLLSPAQPLDPANVNVGVGLHHGAPLAFVRNVPANFTAAAGAFDQAMLRLQSYDELARQFGEYTAYQLPTDVPARGPSDFISTPSLGDLKARAGELNDEIDAALGEVSATGFGTRSVVVDFWRTRRDWYLRWDGLLSEEANVKGKGAYGFGRQKMYDDLLFGLEEVARDLQPRYFVIGSEMELLIATDAGGGISPGEFSSFLSFLQDASARIKAASPETKVGVGINWDRFGTRVAAAYAADGMTVGNEAWDRAFTEIMLPILASTDILTLMTYNEPFMEGDTGVNPRGYYQFLRRIPALYGLNKPVVYYSVSSPIEQSSSAPQQSNFLDAFWDWNSGVNVEAVFWDRLLNIDGADTSDQQLIGRCKALVEDEAKGYNLPRSRCFDGLYDSLFQPKDPARVFLDL